MAVTSRSSSWDVRRRSSEESSYWSKLLPAFPTYIALPSLGGLNLISSASPG